MKEWFDKVKKLIAATDRKLRANTEIYGWIEQQTYSDGIVLYLSKAGY